MKKFLREIFSWSFLLVKGLENFEGILSRSSSHVFWIAISCEFFLCIINLKMHLFAFQNSVFNNLQQMRRLDNCGFIIYFYVYFHAFGMLIWIFWLKAQGNNKLPKDANCTIKFDIERNLCRTACTWCPKVYFFGVKIRVKLSFHVAHYFDKNFSHYVIWRQKQYDYARQVSLRGPSSTKTHSNIFWHTMKQNIEWNKRKRFIRYGTLLSLPTKVFSFILFFWIDHFSFSWFERTEENVYFKILSFNPNVKGNMNF